jgi:serine/threonine-protein kinase RsbW
MLGRRFTVRSMAESQLHAGVAVTIVVSAANDSIQFARLNTTAVAGKIGFDYDAIEDVRIAVSELCGTVIGCASPDAELRLEIMGTADGLTVRGHTSLAPGQVLERDDLSDQVLNVVTDSYDYEVANGTVSFQMNRTARSATE